MLGDQSVFLVALRVSGGGGEETDSLRSLDFSPGPGSFFCGQRRVWLLFWGASHPLDEGSFRTGASGLPQQMTDPESMFAVGML